MPAFIFVSGMFSKRTVNEKNYGHIFSYLVLYVLIKIILYLSSLALYGKGSFTLLTEGAVPWYAFSLFAFSLITIFLKQFNPKYVFTAGVILACFAGYDSSLGDKLVLLRIITFFPFFFAGYSLDPDKVVSYLKDKAYIITAFFIMAALLLLVCFDVDLIYDIRPLLSGRNPYSTLPQIYAAFGGLMRAAYYVVSFLLIGCVIALTPQKQILTTAFGSRTVQAYALHTLLLRLFNYFGVKPLTQLFGISSLTMALILIPVALLITVICSLKILEKPFDLLLSPGKSKQK